MDTLLTILFLLGWPLSCVSCPLAIAFWLLWRSEARWRQSEMSARLAIADDARELKRLFVSQP